MGRKQERESLSKQIVMQQITSIMLYYIIKICFNGKDRPFTLYQIIVK